MNLAELSFPERLWWTTAFALVVAFAATWSISLFDARAIGDEGAWAKTMKFQASLALHLATLALASQAMGEASRQSRALSAIAVLCVAATIFEVGYICLQAWRGEASHFNQTTPFHKLMYNCMAVGAIVITLSATIVGVLVFAYPKPFIAYSLRLAVLLGFVGGALLTLVIALQMGGRMSHAVGVEPLGSVRMPLTGWSLRIGDLRIPHFLATHMMQAIPLMGLLAVRLLPAVVAAPAVWIASAGWIALTLSAWQRALAGLPFLNF